MTPPDNTAEPERFYYNTKWAQDSDGTEFVLASAWQQERAEVERLRERQRRLVELVRETKRLFSGWFRQEIESKLAAILTPQTKEQNT